MRGRLTYIVAILATTLLACSVYGETTSSFDPAPWLEDLDQAQDAVATKYANLEWLVFEREMDVGGLFEAARTQIRSAQSDADARAAFDKLARKMGDGHVQFRWSQSPASESIRNASCEALGFDERIQGGPAATMMPGFESLADGPSEFPAGRVRVGAHKVGVLKIGVFTPRGYPALCAEALEALHITPLDRCDDDCGDKVENWVIDRMTQDLVARLRTIQHAGADVLLVDLVDNGGGTEWAEAVARMLTAVKLKSERMMFVRGQHWEAAFERKETQLQEAARHASTEDRALLKDLAEQVSERLRQARTPCDSGPLWRGQQLPCSWLGTGFYATGVLPSLDPDRVHGKSWVTVVFEPSRFQAPVGIWHGPLIVLVDGGTGSAAEQVAAEMQDNHAAIVMGSPTAGAGCGHTDGGTPTTLKHSGGVLELPDCARVREDGSNEVMGVQPDLLVGLRMADGPRRRGLRIAESLQRAVAEAIEQRGKQPRAH
jgi:hypothetical protein